jgi:glycosyltransferase involved in cell wall biosynthesis
MRVAMICTPHERLLPTGRLSGSVGIVASALAEALDPAVELTLYAGSDAPEVQRVVGPGGHPLVLVPAPGKRLHQGRDLLSGLLPRLPPHFTEASFHRDYFERVAALLRDDPPDIVHLQTFLQHAPLLRAAAGDAQLVLHLHDPHPAGLEPQAARQDLMALDAVVTCSGFVSRRIAAAFPDHAAKVTTIGNGVDSAGFAGEPGGEAQPPRLLFAGRLSPEKGVHVLAEAFDRVAAQRPEVSLDLVGKPGYLPASVLRLMGPDPKLKTLAAFYGDNPATGFARQVLSSQTSYRRSIERRLAPSARPRVRFLEHVPHERMPRVYAESAIIVVPSVWEEPFGLPVVEAMAAARPVVASRAGGMPELVAEGETGLLVEPDEPAALADALLTLLDDPQRRRAMGRAGRRRAVQRWSWQHAAERLGRVYARLMRLDVPTLPQVRRLPVYAMLWLSQQAIPFL